MPFVILFALCWSSLVLLVDCSAGHQCYKQFESGKFPSVTGTITHSELQTHTSKGNIYYTAVVDYLYKVDGKLFTGDTLTFSEDGPAVSEQTVVSSHPVGSPVQVYYNPDKPDESLLYPGEANGGDLAWVLALTPFNIVVIGFCTWIGGWLRLRLFNPVAGGVRIIDDGMLTRVRLPRFDPIWWGLITTGVLGFFSVFVGLGVKIIPVMAYPLQSAGLIVLAGVGVYVWRRLKARSGDEDLVIDEAARTLELPRTFRRKQRVTVAFSDVESVWVDTIVQRGPKGNSCTFAPTLNVRDHKHEAGHTLRLAEWSDPLKADKFTEWLSQKTGASSRRTA
ncbi:MAG TPA: DUF3592 domain-containing protein [Candidatus Sulfotelmatobacter sp.]|nr:DUF3592 domain-containing protein [Candidatus Sulfotelmatobacter sp.]